MIILLIGLRLEYFIEYYNNKLLPMDYLDFPTEQIFPKKEGTLRVMTYNVHSFTNRQHQHKIEQIISLIKKINPDILGLQEVNDIIPPYSSHSYFSEKMIDFGYQVHYSKNRTNMVLSKYPFTCVEINLSPDKFIRERRNGLICNFPNFPDFQFALTHFDVFDNTGITRKNQAKLLIQNITTKRSIIAGDLNSLRRNDYTDEEFDQIVKADHNRNVVTVFDAIPIIESNGWVDSFHNQSPPNISVWSKRRVDYVFCKNVPSIYSDVVHRTFSDHYPVYADVELEQIF